MKKYFCWLVWIGVIFFFSRGIVAHSPFLKNELKAISKAGFLKGAISQKADPILSPLEMGPITLSFSSETLKCDDGFPILCGANGFEFWYEAVRLTPSEPCTLKVLCFYPCDEETTAPNLTWGVWEDNGPGGFPGTLIDSGTVSPSVYYDWFCFSLLNPIFNDSGDIYIGWLDVHGYPFYWNAFDSVLNYCNYWFDSTSWVLDTYFPGDFMVRGVCETGVGIGEEFDTPIQNGRLELLDTHPNPFHEWTTIRYILPVDSGPIHLGIYDLAGREIRNLVKGIQMPGEKRVIWDGRDNRGRLVSSNIYFYRLKAGDFVSTKKLIFLR